MSNTLASRIAFIWIVCLLNLLLFFLFSVMSIIFILHNLTPLHKCTSLWFFLLPLKSSYMKLLFHHRNEVSFIFLLKNFFVSNLDFFFNKWAALPGVAIWISYTLLCLLDRLNKHSISSLNSGMSFTYSSSSILSFICLFSFDFLTSWSVSFWKSVATTDRRKSVQVKQSLNSPSCDLWKNSKCFRYIILTENSAYVRMWSSIICCLFKAYINIHNFSCLFSSW